MTSLSAKTHLRIVHTSQEETLYRIQWLHAEQCGIGSVILQSDTPTPQVVYWVGAMLGAMASLYLTGQVGQQTVDGVSPGLAFLGGVLVLVGARTASGCTRYALAVVD